MGHNKSVFEMMKRLNEDFNLDKRIKPRYENFDEIIENAPDEVKELIAGLETIRERPDKHPEPNTYEHVKKVTNRLIPTGDPDLIMTGIFHDIGKKVKNVGNPKTGHPSAPDHPQFAEEMVEKHRDWIWWFGANPANVKWLCGFHMLIKNIYNMKKNHPKRKEMESSPLWDKLVIFTKADDMLSEFEFEKLKRKDIESFRGH